MYQPEITPENVDYTVGQLALLEASGYPAGALAHVYANCVEFDDAAGEQSVALHIEDYLNEHFYS